jgi:hypothetical protein
LAISDIIGWTVTRGNASTQTTAASTSPRSQKRAREVFHQALGPPRTVLQVFELVVRAAAITKLAPRTLVLDGEVALFDQQLRSWFEWLREPDPDAVATPPLLMAFDILYRDWPRTHRAAAP